MNFLPCLKIKFNDESGRQSSLIISMSSFSLIYQSEKLHIVDTAYFMLKLEA